MASRFISPTLDVGPGAKPASGAKLNFFETGTSTRKDTFTDAGAGTPNANPVIADSNGVFPDIFISGTYKVILTDNDDVQVGFGEKDPVAEVSTVDSTDAHIDRLNPDTLAIAIADETLEVKDKLHVEERTTGNDGGGLWNVITKGTTAGVDLPNGFDIVASTGNAALALKLQIGMLLDLAQFGVGQGDADDTAATLHVWTIATSGATLLYPKGQIPLTNLVHPDKQLYHIGTGTSAGRSPDDTSGTVLRAIGATDTYMINMVPPLVSDPANNSRFSSFSNMSCFGNGTLTGLDDDATNNFIKINNQGTNFENFTVRWIKVGFEVNTNTGQKWERMTITCSVFSVLFKYDPATPFNALEQSFSTASTYKDISINTSTINSNAVGWNVDASCSYSQNTLINVDLESCFTAMRLEGRIAAKDAVSGTSQAFGAAAFGGGNNHIGCWFEANTNDVVIAFDAGQPQPLVLWNMLNRTTFVISGSKSDSWILGHNSIQAIFPDAQELGEGEIGAFNNPLTAGQFVISGPNITTPSVKSLVNARIPHQVANRPTITTNSSFELDMFLPVVPVAASPTNIINVFLDNATQAASVEISMVATDAANVHHFSRSTHLATNTADAIADVIIEEVHNGATQPLFMQAIRTGVNTFGIFVWKDATLGSATACAYNVKITIGGSSGGGNGATISTLL